MKSRSLLPTALLSLAALSGETAHARGYAGIETSSFFRTSDDRPTNGATISLGGRFENESNWGHALADVKINALMLESPSFASEAYELYVSTSSSVSARHRLSFGRKRADWSRSDQEWSLGMWSPRFLWDPLRPESVGRTGLFYDFRSEKWRFTALASPFSIPERGAPMVSENGSVITKGLLWVPLPSTLRYQAQTLDLRYDLNMPSLGDMVIKPNAALSLRYGADQGAWSSVGWSYAPLSQADVAIDARIQLPDSETVRASLYPRFPYHHLVAAEGGYQAKRWHLWGSLTREIPVTETGLPSEWMKNGLGAATLGSAGAGVTPLSGLRLNASYLRVSEDYVAPSGASGVDLTIPSRFSYTQAFRVSGDYAANDRQNYALSYVYDLDESAALVSADLTWRMRQRWTLGFGADWIWSDTRTGWFGQYEGNERIRWSVNYAF